MSLINTFTLDLDLKNNNYISEPQVTSNDAIRFVVNVIDDGLPFELTGASTFSLSNTRPDGVVVIKSGTKTGTNQLTFDLGSTETTVSGRVNAKVQIYDDAGRVSTVSFSYTVDRDPSGEDYVPSTNERTLIEAVLGDGGAIIAAAEEATENANNAAQNANNSVSNIQGSEDIRITAETTRKSNETARGTAESARVTAETTRASNETIRINAESARVTAETTRASNETSRGTAESGRAGAETSRATAEGLRVTAETTRNTNETTRKNAETARVSEETTRVTNETTRKNNETARVTAESARVTAETTRTSNETARGTAEGLRVTAEGSRVTTESARVTAETARASNETARVSNETARGTAESTRQSQETARQTSISNVIHKGTYSAATAYVVNNSVTHTDGSSYRCIQNTNGNPPTNATYWVLEAKAGANGSGTVGSITSSNGSVIIGGTAQVPDLKVNTGTNPNQIVVRNNDGKIDDIVNELSRVNILSTTIKHGLNVIDTPAPGPMTPTIYGRTLVNLLGKDGGCESLAPFTTVGTGTSELSGTQKRSGNSAIKISTSATYRYLYTDYLYPLDTAKQYILGLWVYVESHSSGVIDVTIRDVGTTTGRYSAAATTATKGSWQFIYVKIPPSNNLVGTGFRLFIGTTSATTYVAYFDDIRFYEVSAAEYTAIGTTITAASSPSIDEVFPYVDGIQHVTNPVITKTGKNLLPPFTEWTLHANAVVTEPYKLMLNATAANQVTVLIVPVLPNTQYNIQGTITASAGMGYMNAYSVNALGAETWIGEVANNKNTATFTTKSDSVKLRFQCFGSTAGTFTFNNPQLELGSVATAFEPRNDDYLYGVSDSLGNSIKLAGMGGINDSLAFYDNAWRLLHTWKKDVVLDGKLAWTYADAPAAGIKLVAVGGYAWKENAAQFMKYNGNILRSKRPVETWSWDAADKAEASVNKSVYLTISNADSGWNVVPSAQEIAHYFNGWKMSDNAFGLYSTGTKYWTPVESPKADFVGKSFASNVANPHLANFSSSTTLTPPTSGPEIGTSGTLYSRFSSLDSTLETISTTTNLWIPQIKFSFDLIQHIIRNYGEEVFGTAVTTTERVAWLKANVGKITCNWYGFGSGPTGNKATLQEWDVVSNGWTSPVSHTAVIVSKLFKTETTSLNRLIDANGFVHFLAYADASNGTVASTINTDFVELEVNLLFQAIPSGMKYSHKKYTPYSLTYQLAKAEEEVVNVEGAISLQAGGNQIEVASGVVVREKVTPVFNGSTAYVINQLSVQTSWLKNRVSSIVNIFKNGKHDNSAVIVKDTSGSYGYSRAFIATVNYDPTATYTVTYMPLDKYTMSANVVDVKAEYAGNIGSTVSKLVQDMADNNTLDSVQNWRLMLDEAYAQNLRVDLDKKQAALGFTPENVTKKGVVNGYAGLGPDGKVPLAQLPPMSSGGKKVARFVIGTSASGWTSADCDYLCDGVGDQLKINSAIAALPVGGGEIVILDGIYNINAKISITRNNVTLIGNGNSTVLKRTWNGGGGLFEGVINLVSSHECVIANLTIEGIKNTYNEGIMLNNCSNISIRNNMVVTGYNGISVINGCNHIDIVGNRLTDNYEDGINMDNAQFINIHGNFCTENLSDGMYLYDCENVSITGNVCRGHVDENGIILESCDGVTIANNVCENNDTAITVMYYTSGCTIVGNTCFANGNGICVMQSNNNVFSDNSIYSSAYYGIVINTNSRFNTFDGNSIALNEYGCYIYQSSNNIFSSNIVTDNSNHGFYSYLSDFNLFSGNLCKDNPYGVFLQASNSNNVVGNNCTRGAGAPGNYGTTTGTIFLHSNANNYNLISSNNCKGKDVVIEGGTSNTSVNNKWN